jgi:photosystem II stability/assembly factor-like uncharacterized protein
MALSYAPNASMQSKKGSNARTGKAKNKTEDLRQSIESSGAQSLKKTGDTDASKTEDDDPDLPPGMAGKIDKEAYLRSRGDYIDMLRGRPYNLPYDPREKAIQQMDRQEAQMKAQARSGGVQTPVDTTNWAFLGPAPIPLGQTSTTRVPVSGRTIAIAVHPTDADTVYVGTAQGGLYKSTNGGTNWSKLFEFQFESLAIGAITIDPTDSNIIYVGTGEPNLSADSFAGRGLYIIRNANSASPTLSGPFRLDGGGVDVFTNRAIGRIQVNPLNNNVIFVCTTSGTGGNPNATPTTLPPRGLYRSTNAQSANPTFTQVQITGITSPNDRSTIDIALDPSNPDLLIATVVGAASDGGIYRTANAQNATPTFTRTLTLPDGSTNGRAELYLNRNGSSLTIYAATGEISTTALGGPNCGSTTAGLLRRSTDGGLTWSTPLTGSTGFCGGQCFYDMAIAVTPDNQTIHLGGSARGGSGSCLTEVMKRSTNGGASFSRNDATLHADEHALAIAPSNPLVVYTGSDGGIWRSTNNGTTWTTLNNFDFSATQFQSVALHPYDRFFLMGGTQDNGTNCLSADGLTWGHCRDGDGGYVIIDDNAQDTTNVLMYHTFFNQTNSQIGFERATSTAANADGQLSGWVFRGCSGATANNGFRCADNVLFYAPMAQGPGNPNTIYFGTDRLYRSTNRGDTMTLVSQGPLVPSSPAGSGVIVTTIGISPQDDNVRIVGLRNGQVFATTTGSATMTDVTGANFPAPNPLDPTRNPIGHAVIDPNNKFTAYVTFTSFSPAAGQQIFKTTNLNSATPTWTPASNGIPTVPISGFVVDPQDSNSLYAGTDIGVYHSSDGGANWMPLGTGLPRVAVFDMKISNVQRLLRIATHGRGIWEIGIPGRQLPVMRTTGTALVSEGCTPANGVIDPGEDVTLSLSVSNIGPGQTNDLVVTLSAVSGVTFPSAPVHYGVVGAGASATQNFRFSNNGTCGNTITLFFHLQDGTLDLGNFTATYTLGVLQTGAATLSENFDGVTAPALPTGWTTTRTSTAANTAALWVTSTTANHTPANSIFGAGGTVASESNLNSPTIAIPTAPVIGSQAGVQLAFRNSYNTEAGFDGAVLEISINGGAFQDIIVAGGSFASGGYNGIIGPTDSTLNLRNAWTGNSGGFVATVVNLPTGSFGQNVQLRWRAAFDSGTNPTGGGIRVDTLSIYTVTYLCCSSPCVLTCPANITVSNDLNQCGAVVTYPAATLSGSCGTVASSPASGSFFPVGTTTVTVTATKLDGSSSSCTFTVKVNDTQLPTLSSSCPANITAVTPTVGGAAITVNFTAPTVADNCPGATVSCVPPSGSSFPVGTTTVTCTPTDAAGNVGAGCSFTVTIFNACVQDDSNPGAVLLFSTQTGDYRFCCGGTTFTGKGTIAAKGLTFTLTHNAPDRRVTGKIDGTTFGGSASLQSPVGVTKCTVTDRDTRNNTCSCQ